MEGIPNSDMSQRTSWQQQAPQQYMKVIACFLCLSLLICEGAAYSSAFVQSTWGSRAGHILPERRAMKRGMMPQMLWSGGRRTRPDQVTVNIERPSLNSRRISGSIIVDKPIEDVWLVLTDYDRLSDYVPNLTQSRQVPSPTGGIRLFQEGAQQIVGFDFRASLVMDMEEHYGDPDDKLAMRKIKFKLVDSAMFTDFSGEWRLQFNSRIVNKGAGPGQEKYTYSTKVFYMVNIRPKGVVPVVALEWQISEEVPNNLAAVKRTAEVMDSAFFDARQQAMDARQLRSGVYISGYSQASATAAAVAAVSAANVALTTQQPVLQQQQQRYPLPPDQSAAGVDSNGWETDETLEAYIQKISANRK